MTGPLTRQSENHLGIFMSLLLRLHKFTIFHICMIIAAGLLSANEIKAQNTQPSGRALTVASSNNFPPINMLDNEGNLVGFGRDVSTAAIEAMGGTAIHIHSAKWVEVLGWLESGRADLIHDTGYTPARDDFLDYSAPIIEMPEVIFVRPDEYTINDLHALKGKKVACVRQHISHLYLQNFPEIGCYVVQSPMEGLYALVSKDVDAFVYPQQIIQYLAQEARLSDKLKIAGAPLRTLSWSMTVKEGNNELIKYLNAGLAKIRQNGAYDRIYAKWWGKRILSGYSHTELLFYALLASLATLSLSASLFLIFFNRQLKKDKAKLLAEVASRQAAEKMLRASENQFKELTENVREVIWSGSPDWREVYYVTPAYEDIWQRSRDSLYENPQSWLESLPEEDRKQVAAALENVNSEEFHELIFPEYRVRRPDGTSKWIAARAYPVHDNSGKVIRVTGIAEDITDRRNASQSLERAAREWREAMDASDDAIYLLDLDRHLLRANKTFYRLTGSSPDTALGKHIGEIVHPGGEDVPCPVCEAQEEKRDTLLIMEADHPDNPVGVPLEVRVKIVRDRSDAPLSIFMTIKDLTVQRQELNEKLLLKEQLLQAQKMEAIGTLAGGIAHDFNNILAVILGNAELAAEEMAAGGRIKTGLQEIIVAAKRARDLVRQILSFSRKADQEMQPIKPQTIIKETVKLLRATIPTTVEIRPDLDHECGTIIANPTQIHQLVMNLATNAAQAMQGKGVLTISLKKTLLDDNALAHRPDMLPGPYILLTISDTGPGVDPKIVDRIYDPFFTTKEVGQGTGMGLAVVHGIVTAHHGMIILENKPGAGATFHVYFAAADAEEHEAAETMKPAPTGSETILLVDDEEMLVKMSHRLLEGLGYRVISETSSMLALATFKAKPQAFDLVITDQTMPEMSGTELVEELLKVRADMPIILCTGYSSKISEDNAQTVGVRAIMMKPYDKTQLAGLVRKVLDET